MTVQCINSNAQPPNGHVFTWAGLNASDRQGAPQDLVGSGDRTVQAYGDFAGATLYIEGSLDGTHWARLNDAQGVQARFTQPGMMLLMECPSFIRPVLEDGSSPDVTLVLAVRR